MDNIGKLVGFISLNVCIFIEKLLDEKIYI